MKTDRKVLETSNLAYAMVLVHGRLPQKICFAMCLLAVLGSQGIVVKFTTATFFRTMDYI